MTSPQPIDFEHFQKSLPEAVTALRTLSAGAGQGMDKGLLELIKVRASQLNGCAYCLQLHLNWARKAGVSQAKLDRLAVWSEAPDFSAEERAALAWAEALHQPVRHEEVKAARLALAAAFGTEQQLKLTAAIAAVNAWNRIAGPLGFTLPAAE